MAGLEGTRDFFGVCAPSARRRGEAFQFWNLHRCTGQPMLLALHAGRAARRESLSASAEAGVQPGFSRSTEGISTQPSADFEAEAVEATMGYLRNIFERRTCPRRSRP